jgi:NAD-dependent SIR2 family protein deacetylase
MALTQSTLNPIEIERAAEVILQADALIVAAGAGMGVDSGLPDFRGREGFWRAYPALATRDLAFSVLNPDVRKRPATRLGLLRPSLATLSPDSSHAGFAALLRWAKNKRHGYFVCERACASRSQGFICTKRELILR